MSQASIGQPRDESTSSCAPGSTSSLAMDYYNKVAMENNSLQAEQINIKLSNMS